MKGFKKEIGEILHSSILMKYKMKTTAMRHLGINLRNERVKLRKSLSRSMYSHIRDFVERDGVSRLSAGIKHTVTVNKVKKQRWVLNDTLKNLNTKFLSENHCKVSYETFCRLRPFWVKFPIDSDRNTCLCKLCDNTQLMANALKKADIIVTDNLEDITKETVCCVKEEICMFNTCKECETKRINFNVETLGNEDIEWQEWKSITETRNFKVGEN